MIDPSQERDYASSLFHPRHIVAGWEMRPLTFGHACLLAAVESKMLPWVPASVGAYDVGLMAFVCSRGWRFAARVLNCRCHWVQRTAVRYAEQRARVRPLAVEVASAVAYVRFWLVDKPSFSQVKKEGTVESNASLLGSIGARFSSFGIPRREIMDTPFRVLQAEHIFCAEREGSLTVNGSTSVLDKMAAEEMLRVRKESRNGRRV